MERRAAGVEESGTTRFLGVANETRRRGWRKAHRYWCSPSHCSTSLLSRPSHFALARIASSPCCSAWSNDLVSFSRKNASTACASASVVKDETVFLTSTLNTQLLSVPSQLRDPTTMKRRVKGGRLRTHPREKRFSSVAKFSCSHFHTLRFVSVFRVRFPTKGSMSCEGEPTDMRKRQHPWKMTRSRGQRIPA